MHYFVSDPQEISSCKILLDNKNQSRRLGFIRFHTREAALVLIGQWNGKKIDGTGDYLQVRFADSDAQRTFKGWYGMSKKIPSQHIYTPPYYYSFFPPIYMSHPHPTSYAASDSTLVEEDSVDQLVTVTQNLDICNQA